MSETGTTASVRVLLVEDDAMHAELVLRAFEDTPNFDLAVARTVAQAAEMVSVATPNVIVADLNLPDGKGTELVLETQYPLVIMTSQGSESSAVEAMRTGALDYVVKSDEMFHDLPHVVTRALREWNHVQGHARARRFLRAQYEVASALAAADDARVAGAAILEIVCRRVGWIMGEFWRLDGPNEVVRRETYWAAEERLAVGETGGTGASLRVGEALPGATLARGVPISVPDLRTSRPYEGRHLPRDTELKGAFGFPVEKAGKPLGVLTFYSMDAEPPDEELRALLKAISDQIVVLVQRGEAEKERERLQAELLDRARLAAVGQTAATLGHEIANPLNGMYLASQLLQRRLARDPNADPKLVTGVERILKENRRLEGLLAEFRSLTKRQLLKRAPTDVAGLVEHVLAVQSPVLEGSGVVIRTELPPSLPVVDVDDAKLTQVLLNLTKNAVEAMGPEGGELTIRAARDGATVVIEVADNGPGIPDGLDIFAPFQTTKEAGTGLGLAVARQIAEAHGGTLEHVDVGGTGATFRLALPATIDESDQGE